MDENRHTADTQLDELLAEGAALLPPDDEVVSEITPWRHAMDRVIVGLGMSTLTLNFLWLNYLLPAIGAVLLVLGFRSLRRENGWFRLCWILSITETAIFVLGLGVNATIWHGEMLTFLGWGKMSLRVLMLIGLRQGLIAVQRKAGMKKDAGPATALLLWCGLAALLGYVQYSGLIIGGLVVLAYVQILRCLSKLSGEIDQAGYAIEAAPVRIGDGTLRLWLFAAMALALTVGFAFFSYYPMDWQPAGTQTENTELRQELLELGFPEDVLNDLTDEDIAACAGAKRIVSDVWENPVNDGREVRTTEGSYTQIHTEYDVKELRTTGVAVELPGDRGGWKIFHHFRWVVHPGFRGTEALQLWPTDRIDEGWSPAENLTGRLLCEIDGVTKTAPYYSLGRESYISNSFMWGERQNNDVFACFSLPRKGENCRGYVSYEVRENNEDYIIDSWVNYVHQRGYLQYPVMTAAERRMRGGFNDSVFFTVQDALQFYPADENPQTFRQENGLTYD
ncbi:MAG: hypothetical protein ACOX81_09620 [Candidatus Heteroscillospira sp.]